MGSTYNNHQVRAASSDAVIAACQAAKVGPAYVSTESKGWVTVLSDTLGIHGMERLVHEGSLLSNRVGGPVLTTMVFDSEVFMYWLHDCGPLIDEFDSSPDEEAGADARARVRGRPELLASLLAPGATIDQLSAALDLARKGDADEGHSLLALALGIDERLATARVKDIERRTADAEVLGRFQRIDLVQDSPRDYLNKKLIETVRDLNMQVAEVQSLIAKGADANVIFNPAGQTLLMDCAEGCTARDLEVAKLLIQAGAEVNYKIPKQKRKSARAMLGASWGTEEGMTALIYAAEALPPRRTETFMKMLIEAGADVNAKTATGRTALSAAAALADPEFLRKLCGRGKPDRDQRAKEASEVRVAVLRAAGATG